MRGSWMRQKLEEIMGHWTDKEGCSPQSTLRDIITDLRWIAHDEELDLDAAVEGSEESFTEELDLEDDEK